MISEAEQIRKPQPEIFEIALSNLKTTAETSVYIGDNPQADIVYIPLYFNNKQQQQKANFFLLSKITIT